MHAASTLLSRLDARDRALLLRCTDTAAASRRRRLAWTTLTHLGGATCGIVLAVLPFLPGSLVGSLHGAVGRPALLTLVVSHLLVQLVKRTVGRARPSRATECDSLVAEPDRFSFPSGHSAAAMSVAIAYALAFPTLAVPILALAALVGASRVFLGVHYPGDVLAGQLLAVVTYLALSGHA